MKTATISSLSIFAFILIFTACKKDQHQTDLATCDTKLTYEADIKPLLDVHCNSANCHGANEQPILKYYSSVKSSVDNGSFTREVITNRTMPEGTKLSNDDFDLFNCWINAGAPEK